MQHGRNCFHFRKLCIASKGYCPAEPELQWVFYYRLTYCPKTAPLELTASRTESYFFHGTRHIRGRTLLPPGGRLPSYDKRTHPSYQCECCMLMYRTASPRPPRRLLLSRRAGPSCTLFPPLLAGRVHLVPGLQCPDSAAFTHLRPWPSPYIHAQAI